MKADLSGKSATTNVCDICVYGTSGANFSGWNEHGARRVDRTAVGQFWHAQMRIGSCYDFATAAGSHLFDRACMNENP
jgi:hypothetical protein